MTSSLHINGDIKQMDHEHFILLHTLYQMCQTSSMIKGYFIEFHEYCTESLTLPEGFLLLIESPRRGLPLLRAENNIGIYDIK